MNKWKASVAILALSLALTGCGDKQAGESADSQAQSSEVSPAQNSEANANSESQGAQGSQTGQSSGTEANGSAATGSKGLDDAALRADTEAAKKAYDENVKDFTTITMEEVKEKMNKKETFFVYAGFRNCPYCRALSPWLKAAVEEKKLEVFYLDTQGDNPDFNEFAGGLGIEYVPSIFAFKEGEVKATDDFKEPYNQESASRAIDEIMQ